MTKIYQTFIKKLYLAKFLFLLVIGGGTESLYAQIVTGPVKWHPGHYYTLMESAKTSSSYLTKVYNELANTPAFRGVQIRYNWSELEKGKGIYDFSNIDNRLKELTARNKRLVIFVQYKSFTPSASQVPAYLKTAEYDGGVFAYGSSSGSSNVIKGYNIKLWNDKVRDRLAQLMQKLGERYNSHSQFEAVILPETAMGDPIGAISSAQEAKFYTNLLIVNQAMRNSFPNTVTIQFVNYPRSMLKSFIDDGLAKMGASLGGPDVWLDDPGVNLINQPYTPDGVYSYYSKLSGTIPLAPSVMSGNYRSSRHDVTKGFKPTINQLLTFARDNLKANYIFWTRDYEYYEKLLAVMKSVDITGSAAGGLGTKCPTAFASCNTK